MDKLFSIIMPCYNSRDFVEHAFESVVRQTMDRNLFELIAVNDASTDDTLSVLRQWEQKYPDLIKVITYDVNLRQGGARNLAIKSACGEYICFLDSDDWLEPDALDIYRIGIEDGKRDIVTTKCEENYHYPDSAHIEDLPGVRAVLEKVFNEEDLPEFIKYDLGYVCSSVYRREMIINNNVWFPEHLAYEDIYWQRLIKYYAKSACIVDGITLHHYNHSESTLNKMNAPHHIDRLICYEMLLKDYSDRGLLRADYMNIMNDTMETYLFNTYFMFFTKMDRIPDVYQRIRSTLYRYFPDWEEVYDDSSIPMVFQYMLKLFKRVKKAKPADLQPFKDAVLELIE